MHNIEEVLETSKASLLRKIERDFSDRKDAKQAVEMLRRRGKWYTISEIEYIAGYMVSGHDACVYDNPQDYSRVEVYQVMKGAKRLDRVVEKLKKLLGRQPIFGQPPPSTI